MGDAADSKEIRKTFIVPAIKAFDQYDFSRAKISCSLAWLVAKAFGTDNVPEDLKEPFYTDQYEQVHTKPPVVNLLLSAELYCRAGSLILKSDAAKPLLGHDAVIQALAQKGLYVTDQEKLVTERDLRKKPIQISAHLAVIDTLMMAYTVEMVSVEKVVACVQKYSALTDTDLPYDTEDAVMSWMNKVNEHLNDIIMQEQKMRALRCSDTTGGPTSPTKWYWKLVPARYRKEQALTSQMPCIPSVENLLKDSTDGGALAALIHFYCPETVKLEDICLKETMSLADSLYNLQLIQEFCQENLNGCCHFALEDMIYASSSIKNNYLVFMAELFWWFEVVKPSFVQPRVLDIDVDAAEAVQPIRNMPTFPISNATKRSFTESPSSPDMDASLGLSPPLSLLPLRLKQQRPQNATSGAMRRSTSMSYVDGYVGTWPKEKRSSVHGVSFDIPFDKENTMQTSIPPSRGMTRSFSNEGLGFKLNQHPRNIKRNLSFQPVNGQSEAEGIEEEMYPEDQTDTELYNNHSGRANPRKQYKLSNGPVLDEYGNPAGTPSIEEALQIIHDSDKPHSVLQSNKVNNGFFLHSQDLGDFNSKLNTEEPCLDSTAETKGAMSPDTTEVDTGIHVQTEDIQETIDEDSSLRDYTVSMDSDLDHDYELKVSNPRDITSPCPSSVSAKSQAGSSASSSSGVKMTSFAEQKLRKINHVDGRSSGSSSQKTTPESSELNIPHMGAWTQTPEESPVRQGRDPTQLLASEMVHLRMQLEEKRRAIEAQKKKVEAAFTRHRQRMGRTAFLTVVKKKGDGTSPLREESIGSEDEKLSADSQPSKMSEDNTLKPGKCKTEDTWSEDNMDPAQSRWLKSPTDESIGEGDLVEYTKSIEKLNSSLNFLQQEMQRIAQQQDIIMQMREQQAWGISPSQPSPQKQVRELRSTSRSTGSLSPVLSSAGESPRTSHRSPQAITRKSASFHSKTPRTQRPNELKIAPFSRVLTSPQSVDSLPHLRRFSPSQIQTKSFVHFGDDHAPTGESESRDKYSAQEPKPADSATEQGSEMGEAHKQLPAEEEKEDKEDKEEVKPLESTVSEVLSQPVKETFILTPNTENPREPIGQSTKTVSLIEVPLSVLKPLEGQVLEEAGEGGSTGDIYYDDQKMCCGFFFKDDQKGEDDMAMKRAALLEKRQQRERENQQRKQQLDVELEQKKEEARIKAEEERQKKEDEKARREYIKQEFLRRKQLKLIEDMDTVIKPRPASSKQKRPRPKSVHRDIMESPRTPVRASAGSRPRVFSVSSLSLASLNLADNESMLSGKRSPRPESTDGLLSPCRSSSRNEEKDWENGSTTSSVASNTEYTGPKLYKEPSAKSNKHIIQNALAHCCLAGRVNEGQKNKILEEMEKSEANNFLVLLRDAGCQFRSVYTYYPEMEMINKLAGIGPKSISRKMIEGLYKYNSDKKQFSHIPAKTMSASVDAITIYCHLWAKRPVTPKKVLPSKS
ncbi:calmodulin-regulated spectrin-associated protein 2-like isoform X5 [Acipenser ruthenus]|uniref:calmodulin-regulated spectrin-associated protein 2-like isoform X5 n=1 Tax=Acipenser ruthenus TaxID=7906 RepID=UPI0027408A76|nr:calmodulin-regulated spectrin-associated protein 2-like isoform X5 [Acipenser ruthenus]